jgi:hypothetical protein
VPKAERDVPRDITQVRISQADAVVLCYPADEPASLVRNYLEVLNAATCPRAAGPSPGPWRRRKR